MNFFHKRLFAPILIALLALQGCGREDQSIEQVGSSEEGFVGNAPGQPGADGKDGSNGKDGIDGADGTNGRDGIDGANGRDGIEGKAGTDGEKGETGGTGPKGEKGNQGLQGQPGRDGNDGVQGMLGEKGGQGERGIQGTNGKDGKDGEDGLNGTNATLPPDLLDMIGVATIPANTAEHWANYYQMLHEAGVPTVLDLLIGENQLPTSIRVAGQQLTLFHDDGTFRVYKGTTYWRTMILANEGVLAYAGQGGMSYTGGDEINYSFGDETVTEVLYYSNTGTVGWRAGSAGRLTLNDLGVPGSTWPEGLCVTVIAITPTSAA